VAPGDGLIDFFYWRRMNDSRAADYWVRGWLYITPTDTPNWRMYQQKDRMHGLSVAKRRCWYMRMGEGSGSVWF